MSSCGEPPTQPRERPQTNTDVLSECLRLQAVDILRLTPFRFSLILFCVMLLPASATWESSSAQVPLRAAALTAAFLSCHDDAPNGRSASIHRGGVGEQRLWDRHAALARSAPRHHRASEHLSPLESMVPAPPSTLEGPFRPERALRARKGPFGPEGRTCLRLSRKQGLVHPWGTIKADLFVQVGPGPQISVVNLGGSSRWQLQRSRLALGARRAAVCHAGDGLEGA